MFKPLLSILLATSIVACPLFCKAGGSCCAEESPAVAPPCCDTCHDESAPHDSMPADQNPSPENCCQCICSGAVVDGNTPEVLQLVAMNWFALPISRAPVAAISEPQHQIVSRAPLPDDGMNPGRALRCLIMSFLC